MTHIALLRGINVGGKHTLLKKDLISLFEEAGCDDVRTYIQSGNVVYASRPALGKRVPALVAAAIATRFAFDVPVVQRTAAELRRVVDRNPLLHRGTDPKRLCVAFLAEKPSATRVRRLDPLRSPPDTFAVVGHEIYIHYPNGGARTKLTNAYFDTTLGTTSTVRAWTTVLKLIGLATKSTPR